MPRDLRRRCQLLVGEATTHVGGVGDAGFAETVVGEVIARRGRLDILMTAAGFSVGGTVADDRARRTGTRCSAPMSAAPGCGRGPRCPTCNVRQSGSIITLASQLAIAGGKGNSAYIAAKGAIVSLTRTMAVDFATDGIRVNAIAPGAIDTPMLRRSFARHANSEEVREASRNRHAMKRFGAGGRDRADRAASRQRCVLVHDRYRDAVVDGGWLAA